MHTMDTLTVAMTTRPIRMLLPQTMTTRLTRIHPTQAMTTRATRLTHTVFLQAKAMRVLYISIMSAMIIQTRITQTTRITFIIRIYAMNTISVTTIMIIHIMMNNIATVIYTIICTHILRLLLFPSPFLSLRNLTHIVMAISTTMATKTCRVYICMSSPTHLDPWLS